MISFLQIAAAFALILSLLLGVDVATAAQSDIRLSRLLAAPLLFAILAAACIAAARVLEGCSCT